MYLMPQTWMAETHSSVDTKSKRALHRQQGWFFWCKKYMRRNIQGNWGDADNESSIPTNHLLCLTTANNHPLHTRLFNRAVDTQVNLFRSGTEERVFPVQLARCGRACPENNNTAATPTAQIIHTWAGDTYGLNLQKQPLLGIPWIPFPKLCQKCLIVIVEVSEQDRHLTTWLTYASSVLLSPSSLEGRRAAQEFLHN